MPIKIEFPSLGDRLAAIGLIEYLSDPTLAEAKKRWFKDDLELLWRLCVELGGHTPAEFTEMSVASRDHILEEARWRYPVKKPRGRKQKWTVWTAGLLVVEVERMLQLGETCESAAYKLSTREPWESFIEGGTVGGKKQAPYKVIQNIFSEWVDGQWGEWVDGKWVGDDRVIHIRNAYRQCLETDNLQKWEWILTLSTRPNDD
jgi:hypothetical protein